MASLSLKEIEKKCAADSALIIDPEYTTLVFGKGNESADIFFIGEAPGAKENEMGIPFVGSAGKRLNNLLESINLTLKDCYIANILKYRPTKNRDPTYEEIMVHTPYLIEQIKAINPKVIVPMGRFASEFALAGMDADKQKMKTIAPISKIHGKPHTITVKRKTYTVIPLYHPAAMIYRPGLKEEMEKDFQVIRKHTAKENE